MRFGSAAEQGCGLGTRPAQPDPTRRRTRHQSRPATSKSQLATPPSHVAMEPPVQAAHPVLTAESTMSGWLAVSCWNVTVVLRVCPTSPMMPTRSGNLPAVELHARGKEGAGVQAAAQGVRRFGFLVGRAPPRSAMGQRRSCCALRPLWQRPLAGVAISTPGHVEHCRKHRAVGVRTAHRPQTHPTAATRALREQHRRRPTAPRTPAGQRLERVGGAPGRAGVDPQPVGVARAGRRGDHHVVQARRQVAARIAWGRGRSAESVGMPPSAQPAGPSAAAAAAHAAGSASCAPGATPA